MRKLLKKILRWLGWMPAILMDILFHFSIDREKDKFSPIKNIMFVPYDEFYFFKFDLLLAKFLNLSLGKTAVLTTSESKFIRFYCWMLGIQSFAIRSPSKENLLKSKKIFS